MDTKKKELVGNFRNGRRKWRPKGEPDAASTTTAQGLKIKAQLDPGSYPLGLKVSGQQLAAINLHPASFHGEWNYSIWPADRKK